jgi:hypothetical protein
MTFSSVQTNNKQFISTNTSILISKRALIINKNNKLLEINDFYDI